MSYSTAHLKALGIETWRVRAAEPSVEESIPVEPAQPVVDVPKARVEPAPPPVVEKPAVQVPPASPDEPIMEARKERDARIARMGWDELETFVRAQSRGEATQAVFGVGAKDASLFVIGEAPGAEEDRRGEPFVGRAGQLLDQMLAAIGQSRQSNTYIANICKFRPPNNRDPRPEEVAEDLPYLQRQIQLVQPRLLLAVGRVAAQNLLDCELPLGRMRSKDHRYAAVDLPVVVSYHPAYLLRSPREKMKSWQDLKKVKAMLY